MISVTSQQSKKDAKKEKDNQMTIHPPFSENENNIEAFEEEQLANLLMTTEKTAVLINIEDIETDILEEYIEENFIEDVAIDELL